jgi:hypothetical protein
MIPGAGDVVLMIRGEQELFDINSDLDARRVLTFAFAVLFGVAATSAAIAPAIL